MSDGVQHGINDVPSTPLSNGEYIVEWNAYRYASAETANGATGSLLFGISHRANGNEAAKNVLGSLKDFKGAKAQVRATAPYIALRKYIDIAGKPD